MKNLLFAIAILSFLTACSDNTKRRKEMIDEEVKSAVESYRSKRLRECMAAITDSANRIADSIVVAQMTAVDSATLLARPKRPIKPILKSPLDTTPVKPILPK